MGCRGTLAGVYDGHSYKLIDDTESSKRAAREYIEYKPTQLTFLIDLRLLGIYPSTFMMLHNYKLSDVERILTNSLEWMQEETENGFTETYKHKAKTYKFYFTKDGLVTRCEFAGQRGGASIRYGAQMEYDKSRPDKYFMPNKITFKRYESEILTADETWNIEIIQFNEAIDRTVCSWKALNPKVGTLLVVDGDIAAKDYKYWSGNDFESKGGARHNQEENNATRRPRYLFALLIVNVVVGAVLLFRSMRQKRDQK